MTTYYPFIRPSIYSDLLWMMHSHVHVNITSAAAAAASDDDNDRKCIANVMSLQNVYNAPSKSGYDHA